MAEAIVARLIIVLIVTGFLAGAVDLQKHDSHSSESHENGHNGGPSEYDVTVQPTPNQNGIPRPGDQQSGCQIDLTIALDYSFAVGPVQNAFKIANYTVTQILSNLPIHHTQVRVAITTIGTNQPFYSEYLSHRYDIYYFIRRTIISRHIWGNRYGNLNEAYYKYIAVNAMQFARPVRHVFLILTAINNPLNINAAFPMSRIVRQKAHVAIVGINQRLAHTLDKIADTVIYTQFGRLNGSVNQFIFDNTCPGSGIQTTTTTTQIPIQTTTVVTEVPTTESPTAAPTSDSASTESPTSSTSTYVEPSTESVTTESPTAGPTSESPTSGVPTVEPTSESPTTEVPTVGPTDGPSTSVEPSTESPTVEPTSESPTSTGPTDGPSTSVAPSTESVTTESPTVEPTSESPTSEVPTVEPTSESPTTEVPTVGPTDGPSTSVEPSTESPTVEPTSESPTSTGPTDGPSTSVAPSTESPTIESTSQSPTTESPTAEPTSEAASTKSTKLAKLQIS